MRLPGPLPDGPAEFTEAVHAGECAVRDDDVRQAQSTVEPH